MRHYMRFLVAILALASFAVYEGSASADEEKDAVCLSIGCSPSEPPFEEPEPIEQPHIIEQEEPQPPPAVVPAVPLPAPPRFTG